MRSSHLAIAVFALGLTHPGTVPAADGPLPNKVGFNAHVRPVLSDKCFPCHGPDGNKRKADLRLDVRESALSERKSVRAIVPGDVDASELVKRIGSTDPEYRMPPPSSRRVLTPRDVAVLTRWVEQGAEYENHWAYRPLERPPLPAVQAASWVRNPIDRFVLAELEARDIEPSPPAPPHVLLRRVGLDIVGLPPVVEEAQAFEITSSDVTYEAAVDRLLASPHFGERMASYWLDLVRYADTNGYNEDEHRNIHPYRDWVIDAFNANMPFDRFTIEQLAGDLLPAAAIPQRVASGYNRLNKVSSETGSQEKEFTVRYAADRTRTTAAVWMGATLGCAECHDHKFDPYTARDFYRFAAFFADVDERAVTPLLSLELAPEMVVPAASTNQQARDRLAALERALDTEREARLAALARDGHAYGAARARWEDAAVAETREPLVALPRWRTGAAEATVEQSGRLRLRKAPSGLSEVTRTFRTHGGDIDVELDVSTLRLPVGRTAASSLGWTVRPEGAGAGLTIVLARNFGLEPTLSMSVGTHKGSEFQLTPAGGLQSLRVHAVWDESRREWTAAYGLNGEQPSTQFPDGGQRDLATPPGVRVWSESLHLRSAIIPVSPAERRPGGEDARVDAPAEMPADVVVEPRPARRHDPLRHLPSELAAFRAIEPTRRTPAQRRMLEQYYMAHAPGLEPWNDRIDGLDAEKVTIEEALPHTLVTVAVEPRVTRVLRRGDWMDETGEIVQPGVPEFLPPLRDGQPANRLGLARWLVSAENPLTARVLVNRLWKQFFGHGIARTLDDVGAQGAWPTHPELLDWLAVELVESGWDVKHLIRVVLMSNTYRQSSTLRPDLADVDPENQLFARQSAFRLDAETIRDNALAISGLLSPTIGGPSVKPYQPDGYWDGVSRILPNSPAASWKVSAGADQYRRGLYTYWKRTFPYPSLLAFDAPSREDCVAERTRSNTPLQALVLLNDPSYVEAARALAALAARQPGGLDAQIRWAHRRTLAYEPDDTTFAVLRNLYDRHLAQYRGEPDATAELIRIGQSPPARDVDAAHLAALTSVCRALLNLHETVTRS